MEGKKLISAFKKASGDLEDEADLMLYYVEEANQQTLTYGDLWEQYYIAVENMFEKTLGKVLKLKKQGKSIDRFQERALSVVESTSHLGWGYHDQLSDFYQAAFPEG